MNDIFSMIFTCFSNIYVWLHTIRISFDKFSFSLWDFLIAVFILSCLVPVFVVPDYTGSFSNFASKVSNVSERIKNKQNKGGE